MRVKWAPFIVMWRYQTYTGPLTGYLGSMITLALARLPLFTEGRGLVVLEQPRCPAGGGCSLAGEHRTLINVCYHLP